MSTTRRQFVERGTGIGALAGFLLTGFSAAWSQGAPFVLGYMVAGAVGGAILGVIVSAALAAFKK